MTFDHPSHPVQQTWRNSDRMFLSSLKSASIKQLYAMQRVFIRMGRESANWKLVAVERELDRR